MRESATHPRPGATMSRMPILCLLFLGWLLPACVDEIDLDQAANLDEGIVLQGNLRLEGQTAVVDVKLEKLFSFTSNRPDRVANATVTLENETGQQLRLPYRDGTYQGTIGLGDPNFELRSGTEVRVLATTNEGRNYASRYEVVPEPVAPTGLRAVPGMMQRVNPTTGTLETVPVLNYRITVPSTYPDGRTAYYRYLADQTFALTMEEASFPLTERDRPCYITQLELATEVAVLSGNTYAPGPITDADVFADLVDYRYAQGSYVSVYQEAINPDAYRYFNQVATLADQSQSIFTNPPGPVTGNVYDVDGQTNNVFGYFYAAAVSTVRVGVTPEEAGDPDTLCPFVTLGNQPPPPPCTDCTTVENSTTTKPDYWEFW